MSAENETITGIANEIRARAGAWSDEKLKQYDLRLANRIEAAAKREVEKLNSVIQTAVSRSDAEIDRLRREAEELRKPLGNAAAMRGALDEILETLNKWRSNNEMEHWQYSQLWDIANAALAAPSRQCDVGTAEEQAIRFNDYCKKQGDGCCIGKGRGACPIFKGYKIDCGLVWSQTPYEESEAAR